MHNGMLRLNGEKMSKSLGNVVWVHNILSRNRAMAFRLQVLQTHYRAPLNYTEAGLEAAAAGLDRLIVAARPDQGGSSAAEQDRDPGGLRKLATEADQRFHEAMKDDFDTPSAVAAIFDLARAINRERNRAGRTTAFREAQQALLDLAGILGLDLSVPKAEAESDAEPFIDLLIDVRTQLRNAKQWEAADRIRIGLQERGIALEDSASGTTWKKVQP
jgi:cysteinyl-tRNA synthetase